MPLAQAMRQTEAFPDYMTDMVALAEQTGRLQDVLPALSAHYTRQDRMIDDVRRAFAVPIALFCVMLAVVFLLITQVLPVFSRVFAQIGVQMSPMAARLMHIGQVLSGAGLGIAIVLGVVVVLAGKLCGGAKQIDEKTALCMQKIADGGSTAQALSESGLFSARDGRLLALSERTGSMA
ncbi:MAG: type II secretion system F family protein, partial [Butyricicoccus pullicaecorum]|nr:type II secretion system F family protein [Butyricicoccus pullicaecorum]